jgi:hypothetical protein
MFFICKEEWYSNTGRKNVLFGILSLLFVINYRHFELPFSP